MTFVKQLETTFIQIFVTNAPKLNSGAKKFLEKNAGTIALVLGALTALTVWSLWGWMRSANKLVDYANEMALRYGSEPTADKVSLMAWLGLAILLAQAILFFRAYKPLQAAQKIGWDYIFYALLLDIAYAIAVSFTDYSGTVALIWSVLWSAVGFYLLFQVRGFFTQKSPKTPPKKTPKA